MTRRGPAARPPRVRSFARWYLGSVLTKAQIEIVDDAGHVEDRVRIVGTGEVALATTVAASDVL